MILEMDADYSVMRFSLKRNHIEKWDGFEKSLSKSCEYCYFPVFRNGTPILAILRDNVQQLRHLGFLIGV